MAKLLTTKELQEHLKIDRTTIYRMLKEGRITGIRIGGQWRFSQDEISALMGGAPQTTDDEVPSHPSDALPVHCIQPIQQVFAEIAQVGSLTTTADGEPLTTISNSCAFCNLILESETGRQACVASWRKLAHQSDKKPHFMKCHAGLHYARGRIAVNGQLAAMVIAGQFYSATPDRSEESMRVKHLAAACGIDEKVLADAATGIPVLDTRQESKIAGWLQKVADTFEQVAHERAELMNRLRSIATMSKLP